MEMQTIYLENKYLRDFNPLDFGQQQCDPLYSFGYNNIKTFLIHYIISGKGTITKGDKTYSAHAGEAFLIRKGESASYIADKDDPWNYIWIRFSGGLSEKFRSLDDVFPAPSKIGHIFEKMLHVLTAKNMSEEYLASQLFMLYIALFGNKEPNENYVQKVKNYIDLHYTENIKIGNIADIFNINRKYLARIFKAETGVSMKEYLINEKMRHASELLTSGYTVSEVAEMCGYSSASHFITMYRKKKGKTPYQKQKR